MDKFKNLEEFNKFCDTSMFCVCGGLMTGLHMSSCRRLAKIRSKLFQDISNLKQGKKVNGES